MHLLLRESVFYESSLCHTKLFFVWVCGEMNNRGHFAIMFVNIYKMNSDTIYSVFSRRVALRPDAPAVVKFVITDDVSRDLPGIMKYAEVQH